MVAPPQSGALSIQSRLCRRSIQSEHFGSLALPVGEFLALEHGLEYWGISDHEQVKVTHPKLRQVTPCTSQRKLQGSVSETGLKIASENVTSSLCVWEWVPAFCVWLSCNRVASAKSQLSAE